MNVQKKSSCILALGYAAAPGLVLVRWRSSPTRVYRYPGTAEEYAAFEAAESKGKHFHEVFRERAFSFVDDAGRPPEKRADLTRKHFGWIGVDLDGTLAEYHGWKGAEHIGDPVPKILELVRAFLADEWEVRIFTARAEDPVAISAIGEWCDRWELPRLIVTNVKDFHMTELYDDRAVSVEPNTGRCVSYASIARVTQESSL